MKARCLNPKDKNYPYYGGRGIKVCDLWVHDFPRFLADMGPRPRGTSLDRWPDQNGNYEPTNCRWASAKDQNRNSRHNVQVDYQGRRMPLIEACELAGAKYIRVVDRMLAGWPLERALTAPPQSRNW